MLYGTLAKKTGVYLTINWQRMIDIPSHRHKICQKNTVTITLRIDTYGVLGII